jgi:hypothetical protein
VSPQSTSEPLAVRSARAVLGAKHVAPAARALSEMGHMDNLYVLSWSPWLEVKIVLGTAAFGLAPTGI